MKNGTMVMRLGFATATLAVWTWCAALDTSPWWAFFWSLVLVGAAAFWHAYDYQERADDSLDLANLLIRQTQDADGSAVAFAEALRIFQEGALSPDTTLVDTPVYMAMGEADSGLTTWLQQAGLTLPPSSVDAAGCTWWFARECIVVRPKSVMAARKALASVARYRGTTPINGVLLTLRLEDLLTRTLARLSTQAQQLRHDMDTLQSELHTRAPVYLVVTQCDALVGFLETFGALPHQARQAILGRTWGPHDAPIEQVVSQLDALMASLGQESLALMRGSSTLVGRDRIYAFPDQLSTLRAPLMAWTNGFFGLGRGRTVPRLRGLYLCSAKQGTRLYDRLCPTNTPVVQNNVPSTAYFTQRIFSQGILPDQTVPTRIDVPLYPRRAARFALAAALMLVLLPTTAYVRAKMRLHSSRAVVAELSADHEMNRHGASLATLNHLRTQVDALQKASEAASFFNTESGMSQDAALLDTVRTLYLRSLRDDVLLPIVEDDAERMAAFAQSHGAKSALSAQEFTAYLNTLRLHLLLSGAYVTAGHLFDKTDGAWLTEVLSARWIRDHELFDEEIRREETQKHVAYFLQAMRIDHTLRLPRNGSAMAAIRHVLTHRSAGFFTHVTLHDDSCVPMPDWVNPDDTWILSNMPVEVMSARR